MEHHTANTNPVARRGVTLMESLIATTVLAVGVVGVSGSLIASSQQTSEVDDAVVVKALASGLMEEIAAKSFAAPTTNDIPGWTAGNKDRSKYDNVADYDRYTDVSPFSSIAGRSIDPGTGFRYTRTVSFTYTAAPTSGASSGTAVTTQSKSGGVTAAKSTTTEQSPSEFGLVQVTVTSSSGQSIKLSRLVSDTTLAK